MKTETRKHQPVRRKPASKCACPAVPLLAAAALSANILAPANALEQRVSVSLFKAQKAQKQYFLRGPFRINNPPGFSFGGGLYELSNNEGRLLLKSCSPGKRGAAEISGKSILLQPAGRFITIGPVPEKLRSYRGSITARVSGNSINFSNQVSMRDYILSVTGSESPANFPLEALKAQCVLVQTAMLRYKAGDDLNDSTEKQAYLGAGYERALSRKALEFTWGQKLCFQGSPVPVYFHACCAGGTSTSELFTGKSPSLACDSARPCRFCRSSGFWKETIYRIPADIYEQRFPEGIPRILSIDKAGRPMKLEFEEASHKESGYSFWLKVGQRLGWDKMPGTRFKIMRLPGGEIELKSTGAGHGVGFCQSGASGMAKGGAGYEKILSYYFPGSRLEKN